MSPQPVLRTVGIVTAIVAILVLVLGVVLGTAEFLLENFVLQTAAFGAVLGVVVAAAAPKQGDNRVVHVLALLSAIMAVEITGYLVVGTVVKHDLGAVSYDQLVGRELAPSDLPVGLAVVMWFPLWTWIISLGGFLTFGLLLFPDGKLPSSRWRPVGALSVAAIATIALGYMILGWPSSDIAITGMEPAGLGGTLVTIGFPVFGLCVFAALTSLFLRYRSSSDVVRHQLRWVLLGVGAMAVIFPPLVIGQVLGAVDVRVLNAATIVIVPFIAAGYGMAIARYRLYDIDIVLNRAIVVAGLGAFITAVYVAIVVGVGQLVGAGDEPNLVLSLAATAIVALAFQPARERVQHWANVVVYGQRATPYEVLSRFSRTAVGSTQDDLLVEAADLLASATGAAVTVWVRQRDELLPTASSPDGADASRPIPAADPPEDPRADLTLPVRTTNGLLGAISIAKSDSETVTATDRDLSERLAAALGLLLRNRALTEELSATVDELARSRDRILAASDAARQMIDQRLRSEPLQQLETLDDELRRLHSGARDHDAERTAVILEQIAGDAEHAAGTVRELASGAYPPRLEAEGLQAALDVRAAAAPFPVSVQHIAGRRYPLPVETAVYFCVLEAIQNATKYAHPTSVQVRIEDRDGTLTFTVQDDGTGFDVTAVSGGTGLSNLRDRLDALGGRLAVESSPGRGTTVRGELPVHGNRTAASAATEPGRTPTLTPG